MYIVRNDVDASPNSSVVELGIGNTLGGRVHLAAGILGGNNVRSNYADQVRVDREVDFKDQTWQRWKIWVDIDQGTYEYAVDGTKSGPLRLGNNDDGSGNIGLIEIEPGTALDDNRREAVVYLDDVLVQYQGGPLQVASGKQLFLGFWSQDGRDDFLVESMQNVRMTMNPAHVTGERMVCQNKPWKGTGLLDMRQFVMKDGDLFRMYYAALPYHFVPDNPEIRRSRSSMGRSGSAPINAFFAMPSRTTGFTGRSRTWAYASGAGRGRTTFSCPTMIFPARFLSWKGRRRSSNRWPKTPTKNTKYSPR